MKWIKITFPQIVFESKEIEVSEEIAESLLYHNEDVGKFVWDNMTEQEQGWTEGQKWVRSAIEEGYAGVRNL
jgi:hypothetical protein